MNENKCLHESFETEFKVGRITEEEGGDPYRFVFNARVRCAQCKEQFEFVGLPAGDVPEHPTTSIDFTELRCPIRPNTGLLATSATYKVKPDEVKKSDIN